MGFDDAPSTPRTPRTTDATPTRRRLKFARRHTTAGADPLASVAWSRRDLAIRRPDGSPVFEARGFEAPESWSQTAVEVTAKHYARRIGGPGGGAEASVREIITRVVDTIAAEGQARDYFATPDDASAFRDELAWLVVHQRGAFNSPVWFNCGLWHAYETRGAGGNWFWNERTGEVEQLADGEGYAHPQTSACFIQSVPDDLGGLFELVKTEARLFKFGSGTGSCFSTVRGRQEKLSSGGPASGVMSFLAVFDRAAGATKSGGTTRRAAKMVVLDVDHPEIVDFIDWKVGEEMKARVLIDAGYPSDFNGEAYATVSGQNSNNSVRVPDEFLRAVDAGGPWSTRMRTTGEVCETLDARAVWTRIVDAAWFCADPGVHFSTTINAWHTCPNAGSINASNPCSEFLFLDDTSCNLASLNLVAFDDGGRFDVSGFRHAARVFFTAQEILVGLSSYPTAAIARNSHDYRPLGLGYANPGALLMRRGLAYDSDEGRSLVAAITALLTGTAYETSAELAAAVGPFAGFEANRDPMLRVMNKHRFASITRGEGATGDARRLWTAARAAWSNACGHGAEVGFRNAQATVIAPTGTIGLMMDCDTTGIEPDFALVKHKSLAGGGSLTIVNASVGPALEALGYAPAERDRIVAHVLATGRAAGAPGLRDEHLAVFACANDIDWRGHVRMLGAVQPFVSGGISKTCNLPHTATREDVDAAYRLAHAEGVKCIALYRDGCKASQPLTATTAAGGAREPASAQAAPVMLPPLPSPEGDDGAPATGPRGAATGRPKAPSATRVRLPKRRRGFTQEATVGGQKVYLRTGEYPDGRLGEVFVDMHKKGAAYRSLMNAFAIAVSLGLQHGVQLEEYVDAFTFTRFEPQGVVVGHDRVKFCTSVLDYLFRSLAVDYLGRDDLAHVPAPVAAPTVDAPAERPAVMLPPPVVDAPAPALAIADAKLCDECGNLAMIRNGTCHKCVVCGASAGCS